MDRDLYSAVRHAELDLVSPLPLHAYETLLRGLTAGSVLDLGCGKATLLAALARRGWHGHGIESSPRMALEARRRASGLPVRITEADAVSEARSLPAGGDGQDLAVCVGSTHIFGGLAATLAELRRLTKPGGRVLVADLYWRRTPDRELLEALGLRTDHLSDLAGSFAAGAKAGLEPLACLSATPEEFEAYEAAQRTAALAWCAENAGQPDAAAIRSRTEHWWELYERHTRAAWGFAAFAYAVPE